MTTDFEAEASRAEIKRLQDLADTVEGKIPNYKETNPGLAEKAREHAQDCRDRANELEELLGEDDG